jgi:hypothetical protein
MQERERGLGLGGWSMRYGTALGIPERLDTVRSFPVFGPSARLPDAYPGHTSLPPHQTCTSRPRGGIACCRRCVVPGIALLINPAYPAQTGAYQVSRLEEYPPEPIRQELLPPSASLLCEAPFDPSAGRSIDTPAAKVGNVGKLGGCVRVRS